MLGLAPTRAAGLARLAGFAPRAGRAYAAGRNADLAGHPHVSGLSAYVRHRLVLESEIVAAAQALHGPAAQKFVAEVLWRTYWKGWMELRPGVWQAYRHGVRAALDRVAVEAGLRRDWQAACTGATGIDCMDHWSRELVSTGYLHNHARMWFASIWVFTLRLPWQLGADFFLRHLTDGDPAANTLSWRWVAGLHTPGKTYLATADNIARHTDGRFRPEGLARAAAPLPMDDVPPPRPAPRGGVPDAGQPAALLLHEDDLGAEFLLDLGLAPVATAVMTAPEGRSPLIVAPHVAAFATGAAEDATRRLAAHLGPVAVDHHGERVDRSARRSGRVGRGLRRAAGRHALGARGAGRRPPCRHRTRPRRARHPAGSRPAGLGRRPVAACDARLFPVSRQGVAMACCGTLTVPG